MSQRKRYHFDLGIPTLINDWKGFFSHKYLAQDFTAGLTVAFVAIPLSLAIALASDVSPARGLTTAIIAGIVCALFGGSKLTVSGPAAAMSVLLADIIGRFGINGLIIIGLMAGCMQLVCGISGLGKYTRFVPLPVIAGFTAGIGFIILTGQLPRIFGLTPPDDTHVFNVIAHISNYFHAINGACLLVFIITFVFIRGLPKVSKKLPAILLAVLFTTGIVYLLNLDDNVPLIGNIPRSLPWPSFPKLGNTPINDLLLSAFSVFLLATLETLLSASAIDKLTHSKKHDANQELIGQGIGNIVVACFGGIPVTGVIARSATNVQAGAKTKRASIIHALIVLSAVVALGPYIGLIPIPALAAVLFSVALNMINIREFRLLWKTARSEAFIYAITFFTIVFTDLIAGIQAGLAAAGIILLLQAAKTHLHVSFSSTDDTVRLSLTGSLTFLSINKIDEIESRLTRLRSGCSVVLDLSSLNNLDTSGANAIIDLFKQCQQKNINFFLRGLARRYESLFKMNGGAEFLKDHYVITENQLRNKIKSRGRKSSRGRLIHGFYRFYREHKYNDRRLFEFIATKQDPHTLFITCSDSRISPTLITSSEPGELFTVRNVGNFVPPYTDSRFCSEAAAVEFVLTNLDITDIVICGHANCGAMKACAFYEDLGLPPHLATWINTIRKQLDIDKGVGINDIARLNVLNQLSNLRTYPLVQEKIARKTLNLHAWFYDFNQSLIFEWDQTEQQFRSIITNQVIQLNTGQETIAKPVADTIT